MRGLVIPPSVRLRIPDNPGATRETLKLMRCLVLDAKQNRLPYFRDLASQIVSSVPPKDWQGELTALTDWVRDNIRYTLDPNDVETITMPHRTIELGYGDCDDMAILLATLCECVGHPCAFAALGFDGCGEYSHVLVIASGAGEQPWVALDPTEDKAHGWFPPGVTCEIYCPITEAAGDMPTMREGFQ